MFRRRPARPDDPVLRMAQWWAVFFFAMAVSASSIVGAIRIFLDGSDEMSFGHSRKKTTASWLERPEVDIEQFRLFAPPEDESQWRQRVVFSTSDPRIMDFCFLPAADAESSPTLAAMVPGRLVLAAPDGTSREIALPDDIPWDQQLQLSPIRIDGKLHLIALASHPSRVMCLDLDGNIVWDAPAPEKAPTLSVRTTRAGENVVFVHSDDMNNPTALVCYDARGNWIFGWEDLQAPDEATRQSEFWLRIAEARGEEVDPSSITYPMSSGVSLQFPFIWSPLPQELSGHEGVIQSALHDAAYLSAIGTSPTIVAPAPVALQTDSWYDRELVSMFSDDPGMLFMMGVSSIDAVLQSNGHEELNWSHLLAPHDLFLRLASDSPPALPLPPPDPVLIQWIYGHSRQHDEGIVKPDFIGRVRGHLAVDLTVLDSRGVPLGALYLSCPHSYEDPWEGPLGDKAYFLMTQANLLYHRGHWFPLVGAETDEGTKPLKGRIRDARLYALPEEFLLAVKTGEPLTRPAGVTVTLYAFEQVAP